MMRHVINDKERKSKAVEMILSVLLLVSFFSVAKETVELVQTINLAKTRQEKICVVIDAGHGGNDPGKIGVNGELEKDINLAIAHKLKDYLETQNIEVVMTREDDKGLYEDSDSNKKVKDMKQRLSIIESKCPALVVSIHQNSYPSESVSGVQVFYYKDSIKSEKAALIMQQQLINTIKPEKEREAKDNTSYYLLKKTSSPIIIVECGFLSNNREAKLLSDENYQKKIAWGIHMGILKYLNSR